MPMKETSLETTERPRQIRAMAHPTMRMGATQEAANRVEVGAHLTPQLAPELLMAQSIAQTLAISMLHVGLGVI